MLTGGARVLGLDLKRFAIAFTAVFAFAYASWIIGSFAYVAVVTPADQQKFGIGWSLKLTNEGGYVVALLFGLIIANFFPRLAEWLKEAIRPELYIKIAIVILGAFLAVTAAGRLTLATSLLWRGIAAIIEAYLIYWAVVYYIARKWFGFNREWAAPLASGISICGVSAAIAVGGAIRARPIVPVMVSSLVVIFAVVEVLILPFLAQSFLWQEPMVAGAWMGLAVKTDGAAIAGGGITESLILAKSAAEGIRYQPGWILGVTATVKVFIDIFIGIWAFVLGYIWTKHINPTQNGARIAEIWQRFPKFIIGFVLTFVVGLALAPRNADRNQFPAARRHRRSQYVSGHLLHSDILLDRRSLRLQKAMAGRRRQTRGRLPAQPVRFRDLGRARHFLAVLCRGETAARQLNLAHQLHLKENLQCPRPTSSRNCRTHRPSRYCRSKRS